MKLIVKIDYQPAILIDVEEHDIGPIMKAFQGGVRVIASGYQETQRWILSNSIDFSMEILKAGSKIVTEEENLKLKAEEEAAEADKK